jgi:hypothetical protein
LTISKQLLQIKAFSAFLTPGLAGIQMQHAVRTKSVEVLAGFIFWGFNILNSSLII